MNGNAAVASSDNITGASSKCERNIIEPVSAYESLDVTPVTPTKVHRSTKLNSYAVPNHEYLQLSHLDKNERDTSYKHHSNTVDTSINEKRTSQKEEDGYDAINEYEHIQSVEEGCKNSAGSRPLPVIPVCNYENLTRISPTPTSTLRCGCNPKVVLKQAVIIVITLVISVVVTMIVINRPFHKSNVDDSDEQPLLSFSSSMKSDTPTTSAHESVTKDYSSADPPGTAHRADGFHAELFLNKSKLLGVISFNGTLTGITVLDSEIFVTRLDSSQVSAYDTSTHTFSRNITISGSRSLQAIVASPRHNCLYISDVVMHVIYLHSLTNNVTTQWFVSVYCLGLSLTGTDNLLATSHGQRRIEEYTPNGNWIREISLDKSMEGLEQSVELSSDRLVVSHGGWTQRTQNRVCIVDMTGRIIKCYGGANFSVDRQLKEPSGLAVDIYNNILVADRNNYRIVLLSSELTSLGIITVPGHQLSSPVSLHLDQVNHRLYIGERILSGIANGRVSILGVDDSTQ